MLDKIYASTLYKASKNKAAIKSALKDPINAELVHQLREYLDDDVREKLEKPSYEFNTPGMFSEDNVDVDFDEMTEDNEESAKSPRGGSIKPATFTSKSDHMDDLEDFESDKDSEEPVPATAPVDTESDSEEASVESATIIQNKLDLESMQGTLNSREDTAGVSYILQKDDELWIHYNDSVNLNNVMENVVRLFRDLGYDNLTFNRLARSANAIVFEIVITNINNYTMAKDDE